MGVVIQDFGNMMTFVIHQLVSSDLISVRKMQKHLKFDT